MEDINKYIEIKSDKRFGYPTLKGTRITVYDVLNWLSNGLDSDSIIKDFPEITKTHIQACLRYASLKERNLRVAL